MTDDTRTATGERPTRAPTGTTGGAPASPGRAMGEGPGSPRRATGGPGPPPEVEVVVHFFGQAREAAGAATGRYRVLEGESVRDIARRLASLHPALAPHLERCSFAVNESYAGRDEPVGAGDEIAVIPPIGGG